MQLVGALRAREAARYVGLGLSTFKTLDLPYKPIAGRGGKRPIRVYRIVDLDAFLADGLVWRRDGPTADTEAA